MTYLVRDRVAIIEISNPPANALNPEVRRDLAGTLVRARNDDDVGAIVLRARGRGFGSVVDPDGYSAVAEGVPSVRDLCDRIENLGKPVVGALHGHVLGPSADIALACHYRVAQSGMKLGFPDLRLGLTPSGGGALRLPRLVGADIALEMLLHGKALSTDDALRAGGVDRVVQDKAGVAAFAFARDLAASEDVLDHNAARAKGKTSPDAWLRAVSAARKSLGPAVLPAAREVLSIVEAALLLPTDEAHSFDASAHEALARTEESVALCRLNRAERRASQLPERLGATPRALGAIGILGSDALAISLATACLSIGLRVVVATEREGELEDSYARIGEFFDNRASTGLMTDADVDDRLDALTMVCGFQAFKDVDVILETSTSDTQSASDIAAQIDPFAQAGTIFAVLSPAVNVHAVARSTSRAADVMGVRLFGTAQTGTGAEILAGTNTSRHAIATVFALLRLLGKLPVLSLVDENTGGISARLASAIQTTADALISMGAQAGDISEAFDDWGLTRAVFEARLKDQHRRSTDTVTDGATALAIDQRQKPGRAALGIEAIRRLCLASAVNAGARLVADGVALKPGDIDVLAVHGLGFKRHTGGPMTEGDLAGLLSLRRALPRLGDGNGIGGTPNPLLDDLIKNGRSFEWLDRKPS